MTSTMRIRSGMIWFIAGLLVAGGGAVSAQQISGMLFPDMTRSDYFYDSVNRFASMNIVKGYNDGRFGPHDYVTRGQAAVLLDRYDKVIVDRLRLQIEALRQHLGLGQCGDGDVQVGEQCDDGNSIDGDGCTRDCLSEVQCPGGYKIGESYPAPDGCNTCTCTALGSACTEMACSQKKCFSSDDCLSNQICSVEQGDCRYPCPPNAVCIQACAGVCVPRPAPVVVCGDGVCAESESELSCPDDCYIAPQPTCGDGVCDTGEANAYKVKECPPSELVCIQEPEVIYTGSCPEDCHDEVTTNTPNQPSASCDEQKAQIDAYFQLNAGCFTDSDCALFMRGCSPYLTCGKPVRADKLSDATALVLEYVASCTTEETVCAGCLPSEVACVNNICQLTE